MANSRPVAFITGAGSGIGRAVALELSSTHAVIAADRDAAGLERTVSSIGASVMGFVADVSDLGSLEAAVAGGTAAYGAVSATVACAGIEVRGTALDVDVDEWNRCIGVNLTGVMLTAKCTLPSLLETGGSFTAISSDAGISGSQGYAPYVASKHGVVGLVRAMAMDFAPQGVRSNVLCPGFVQTPMADRLFAQSSESEVEFYRKTVPLGRFAKASEVAGVVRHFIESPYSNGVVYSLDGGSTTGYFMSPDLLQTAPSA